MNLSQLIKQMDNIESNAPSFKRYINESVYNAPEMTKHWKKLDEGFFQGYSKYLAEAPLTPEQIQNIFKQAGGSSAGGEAAKDPGKLEAIVDKVLPTSQAANLEKSLPEPDAGPVQGFEQKAAQAVQGIQGADDATKQSLMQWVKNGIKKPETQQLILAALSAGIGGLISKVGPILSMIPGGGPVVSAITGAVIAGAVAVASAKMQGKDWKSAFKGAIKPALMGGASAVVGNLAATAIGALTSGSGSGADTAELPGASVGVGDKMPDGSEVTGLDGGQVTVKHPDGTSETLSTQDYYGRTGQQGIADPNAAPAPSDKPRRQLPQWAQDLQAKQQQINDFAQQMGLPPGKHDVQMQGGVPVSIDGQPVPQNLYTPDQQRNIQAAQQMSAMNNNSAAAQPITPATPSDGSYQQAAPLGADGKPMQQVPMDEPPAQITPRLPPGASMSDFSNTAGAAPVDTSQAPQGSAMDPEYLKRVAAGEPGRHMITPEKAQAALDWQAQNGGQVQPPKGDWSSGGRNQYPGGLAQWYKDHPGVRENAVNKQATLRERLKRDQLGGNLDAVQFNPVFVEGMFDTIKGMFGGGKAAPAGDKKEPTMGASVDSLNQAWKAAGSPTDSDEVAKILQGAGIAPEVVAKIYADLKIPAPGATSAAAPTTDTPAAGEPSAETPAEPTAPATPGVEPPATPAAEKQSKVGVGQINKIIPTLRVRDLTSVQKNVDATLAKRGKTAPAPQPTAEGKYVGFYSKFLGKEI
jgi:hypothetical protein